MVITIIIAFQGCGVACRGSAEVRLHYCLELVKPFLLTQQRCTSLPSEMHKLILE